MKSQQQLKATMWKMNMSMMKKMIMKERVLKKVLRRVLKRVKVNHLEFRFIESLHNTAD